MPKLVCRLLLPPDFNLEEGDSLTQDDLQKLGPILNDIANIISKYEIIVGEKASFTIDISLIDDLPYLELIHMDDEIDSESSQDHPAPKPKKGKGSNSNRPKKNPEPNNVRIGIRELW